MRSRDLEVNKHRDSKFAFHLLHSHALSGKKGACSPPRGPQVNMPILSYNSGRQLHHPFRCQSRTAKGNNRPSAQRLQATAQSTKQPHWWLQGLTLPARLSPALLPLQMPCMFTSLRLRCAQNQELLRTGHSFYSWENVVGSARGRPTYHSPHGHRALKDSLSPSSPFR